MQGRLDSTSGEISRSAEQIFYVYSYTDPRTDQLFYIGKGKGQRRFSHLKQTKENCQNLLKFNKIQKILSEGLTPDITIIQNGLTSEQANQLEIELIRLYGRKGIDKGGILTNRTKGGEGGSAPKSKEVRDKISRGHIGKTVSKQTRQRMSDSRRGKTPWNLGLPMEDGTRKKISTTKTGVCQSQATRNQMIRGQQLRRQRENHTKRHYLCHGSITFVTNDLKKFSKSIGLDYATIWRVASGSVAKTRSGWSKSDPVDYPDTTWLFT